MTFQKTIAAPFESLVCPV